MARIFLALILLLAACAQFPQLDAVESAEAARAPYPVLIPLTGLLAEARTGQLTDPTLSTDLAGRAERLRARARALRAPAVSAADIARLRDAVARLSAQPD